jgi:hypothetical protein
MKVLGGENPAAWINGRSGQCPLMRIDPDHVASVIGREQQVRRSRTLAEAQAAMAGR